MAVIIDHDTTTFTNGQPALTCQFITWTDPCENRIMSVSSSAPSAKLHHMCWSLAPSSIDDGVAFLGMNFNTQIFDFMAQGLYRPKNHQSVLPLSVSANSTTWVSRFRSRKALAASRPSKTTTNLTHTCFRFRLASTNRIPDLQWYGKQSNFHDRYPKSVERNSMEPVANTSLSSRQSHHHDWL